MFILILIVIFFLLYRFVKKIPENSNNSEYEYSEIRRSGEDITELFAQEYKNADILTVYDFDVAGVKYSDYYLRSSKVKELDDVFLEPMPDNEYDSEAIAVFDKDDIRIGWMPNIQTMHKHDLFKYLEQGRPVAAKLIKKTDGYPANLTVAYARYSVSGIKSDDSELFKSKIVDILNNAGKDVSILDFSLKGSNMFIKINNYQILKIKFDGKLQYFLLNINYNDFVLPKNCNLDYAESSKSEGNRTRVYIKEVKDLNYFADYIISEFEKNE